MNTLYSFVKTFLIMSLTIMGMEIFVAYTSQSIFYKSFEQGYSYLKEQVIENQPVITFLDIDTKITDCSISICKISAAFIKNRHCGAPYVKIMFIDPSQNNRSYEFLKLSIQDEDGKGLDTLLGYSELHYEGILPIIINRSENTVYSAYFILFYEECNELVKYGPVEFEIHK